MNFANICQAQASRHPIEAQLKVSICISNSWMKKTEYKIYFIAAPRIIQFWGEYKNLLIQVLDDLVQAQNL